MFDMDGTDAWVKYSIYIYYIYIYIYIYMASRL